MSPAARGDASPAATGDACAWCKGPISAEARSDSRYCGKSCRQTAFRLRRRYERAGGDPGELAPGSGRRLVIAYADPPYPGTARKYYGREASYAGEVDHRELLASLVDRRRFDGWALSTSAKALRTVLPLCPPGVRVCAWVKPKGIARDAWGIANAWEPLIVSPARHLRPGKRDWLMAHAARGGGRLPGRKPLAFCAWLFELLGMEPQDELVDLFPGTGIVGRPWAELSRRSSATKAVAPGTGDASPAGVGDVSSLQAAT